MEKCTDEVEQAFADAETGLNHLIQEIERCKEIVSVQQ